jgi:hypothetical protein
MRPVRDMKIIQIDVTNVCYYSCSNCTRFVGHQKKPFFMDYNTFKKAVDSLYDFPGIVGIIGGEPTLHPQFSKFMHYYVEKIPDRKRRNLWTSLGKGYYKHFETIKDTFSCEFINDHMSDVMHQPILVASDEVYKDKNKMWELIENCWVQNKWSATITPKGAFFCEVAAALDMLLDGPGGWAVESGWWKKDVEEYTKQKEWACKKCGAAIPLRCRNADDGCDDISSGNLSLLHNVKSPKVKKGKFVLFNEQDHDENYNNEWKPHKYIMNDDRISEMNKSIKPRFLEGVFICGDGSVTLSRLSTALKYFDNILIILGSKDDNILRLCKEKNVKYILKADSFTENNEVNWGSVLKVILDNVTHNDWIMIVEHDLILPKDFLKQFKDCILNPGFVYLYKGSLLNIISLKRNRTFNSIIFNLKAKSLSKIKSKMENINEKDLVSLAENIWPKNKIEEPGYKLISENLIFNSNLPDISLEKFKYYLSIGYNYRKTNKLKALQYYLKSMSIRFSYEQVKLLIALFIPFYYRLKKM